MWGYRKLAPQPRVLSVTPFTKSNRRQPSVNARRQGGGLRRKRHNLLEMGTTLEGRAAVVTGGTFGVGRGIASALAQSGARVFVTGRSVHDRLSDDANTTGIRCDHRVDEEVVAAFRRVVREVGAIDILINNVWGGYERMLESAGTSRHHEARSGNRSAAESRGENSGGAVTADVCERATLSRCPAAGPDRGGPRKAG